MTGQVWAQPAPTPFACTGELYQLRATGPTAPKHQTDIYKVDLPEAPPSPPPSLTPTLAWSIPGVSLNGLAFNPQDGFLYAVNNYTSAADFRLYQLGSNGGALSSVPITLGPSITPSQFHNTRNSGTFDAQGNLFIADGQTGTTAATGQRLYLIEGAASASPIARRVSLSSDTSPPTGYSGATTMYVGDLTYSHTDSDAFTAVLYGTRAAQGGTVYLYRVAVDLTVTPPTGKLSRRPTDLPAGSTFGSAYMDQQGRIVVSDGNNAFYRVNRANQPVTLLASASSDYHPNTDGTTCRALPQIDVVKHADTPTVIDGHTFDVPYTLTVGNTGVAALANVQISDNLRNTFATNTPALSIVGGPTVTPNPAAASCTLNAGFDGTSNFALLSGTDMLAPGDSCTVNFTVRVTYADAAHVPGSAQPQNNTAYASSASTPNGGYTWPGGGVLTPPANLLAQDPSSNAANLPAAANGDIPEPTPVILPPPLPADMSVSITGLPSVISPGAVVHGKILCTAATGVSLGNAQMATCTATAQDSEGQIVHVAVSNCAPPTPAASLAAGSSISCDISYTAPGVAGGSNTVPTSVTVTASTGAVNDSNEGNNSATSTATLVDAVDNEASNRPAGAQGETYDVSHNDTYPTGSIFSLDTGSTCGSAAISPAGLATFDVPSGGSSCTVAYKVCAPAPNDTVCDTATLTVTAAITPPLAEDDNAGNRPAGAQGETYDVSHNDTYPTGSVFSLDTGSTCANPAISAAGTATFDVPASGGSCTVAYKVCAPAPNQALCDTAVLTVTAAITPPLAEDDNAGNRPAGAQGETYDVSHNDTYPTGSIFSLDTGSTCANPAISAAGTATFDVPASGGSCTVAYKVCAPAPNQALCDTAVLTVTAAAGPPPIQDPPLAQDDTPTLNPKGPTVIPVLDNDPDRGDTAPGSIELARPPAGATLSGDRKTLTVPGQGVWTVNDADNTVIFTPEPGFTGVPTPIGYTFANTDGIRSDVATITLSAAPGVPPPLAQDDTPTLNPKGPTVIPVLDNDPDRGDAAPGSIELARPPAGATLSGDRKTLTVPGQGVWTVNDADNTVIFTPEPGFTSVPTPIGYTFTNTDGIRSDVATITLSAGGTGGVTPIPTLSQWSLLLLAALLGAVALRRQVGNTA